MPAGYCRHDRDIRRQAMTRGRKPLMAMREAVLIAKKRGETRQFIHEPAMICNFVIHCPGFTAFVRIKRVSRIHCSPERIAWEAADAVADLRAIASGSGISRELWVFLPRGRFRFFRVMETGLTELNRDGSVMPEKPGPVPVKTPAIPGQITPAVTGAAPPAQPAQAGAGTTPPIQAPPPELSVGEKPSEKGKGE